MGNAGQFKPKKLNINRIFVIIPAAGLGTRMESDINKQVMEIDGVPVIERTLEAFSKFSSELASMGIALRAVIVTSPDLVYRMTSICKQRRFDFVLNIVTGGDSRMESVWNGIEAISELPFPPMDNDIVFIHDGARCQRLLLNDLSKTLLGSHIDRNRPIRVRAEGDHLAFSN